MAIPASGPLSLTTIQTEFGGTNPIGLNEYYAGGGLVPAGTTGTYGAVPSSGALSVQNFYGTSAIIPVYIEELFSTWLYTGNGATQTITNGINVSGSGGMVWLKNRDTASSHDIEDTPRGAGKRISSNNTDAQNTSGDLTSFNTNGFTVGFINGNSNEPGKNIVSWTFRKQPKFFDVVTWTGDGTGGSRAINHSLQSIPGCLIIKNTSTGATNWLINHTSLPTGYLLRFTSGAQFDATGGSPVNTYTTTTFTTGPGSNASGNTYVAYLFASNAGGFGATGTDNVITCGGFTTDGTGSATVNLGYEPQWVLMKSVAADNWYITDNMRDWTLTTYGLISPDNANAEQRGNSTLGSVTSTGFVVKNLLVSSTNAIYIAIRRGPMKVPTVGTSVFTPITGSLANNSSQSVGFAADSVLVKWRAGTDNSQWYNRLLRYRTGNTSLANYFVSTDSADAQSTLNQSPAVYNPWNTTALTGGYFASTSTVFYYFGRAPKFFDEVIATRYNYDVPSMFGYVTHNLGVQPEMMMLKARDTTDDWYVYHKDLNTPLLRYLNLNNSNAQSTVGSDYWSFSGTTGFRGRNMIGGSVASATDSVVSYLFATCDGVSKVGSYTGNGATQTINCNFTTGARFALIKRIDSAGDWFIFDTARGMTSATDPYWRSNNAGPEVATLGSVTTVSTGFALNSAILPAINVNGGTYIFLAIA